MLAESVVHNDDGTTLIHLRPEARWHNGDDYVAQDVVAYYYINQLEATNYTSAIEVVDDKTMKITWKPSLEPNDNVESLILAVDPVGSVKYDVFQTWVDAIMEIMEAAPAIPEGYTGGRHSARSSPMYRRPLAMRTMPSLRTIIRMVHRDRPV
ncbi:MAG: ABC transporter substrate-binding protein [Bacillus subtilis]|nr:ABC transporter substrate-binding protein [Bacillus subtilis]